MWDYQLVTCGEIGDYWLVIQESQLGRDHQDMTKKCKNWRKTRNKLTNLVRRLAHWIAILQFFKSRKILFNYTVFYRF